MAGAARCRGALLAALALLAMVSAPVAATWTSCATGATGFKVADVTLVPSPVKPGDTANFTIQADASKGVSAGTVSMIVHYAGMPIWTQLDNLCDKAQCPIAPGPTEVRYSQAFPIITPPGFYDVILDGKAGGEQLFCVKVAFQVVPPGAGDVAQAWQAALRGAEQQHSVLSTHRKSLL